ncbi:arylsulfatase [Prosthecobacter sp. SYSU 5D2]|uniref:sulfatase family protein n=1 Tax=Prosthecobacter sp. SYSU 5D2 TaxID=3134134 RepID=UPI0031FEBDA9
MSQPKHIVILLVTLLISLPSLSPAQPPSPSRPNIVFILADDLGYGDVQCLNPDRGKIPTPHLDRLAGQGMTFTDAHSGSSVCTPTRYGLLTGRYSWRTRLQKGVLDGGNDDPLIAADRLTVATFLQQQGYATACIGKWHLGFNSESPTLKPDAKTKSKGKDKNAMGRSGLPLGARIIGGPITRGFDLFWGCSNARTMSSLIIQDHVVEDLPTVDMLPRLTRRAVEYLDEQAATAKSGKPFFLYVPLTSPHTPIVPSAEWQGKSGLGKYGDFVMQTDASVGSILAALDRHQLAENTLVLFSADNGCSPQADTAGLEKQGHFASAQYRGYKADIWDGGHRVPFFARWPGTIPAASRSDALICLGDFMATVADVLGQPLAETAAPDSQSFLPLLRATASAQGRSHIVHHSIAGKFAIREGRWKLNLCAASGGWGKPTDEDAKKQGLPDAQLYDLQADPGETTNLITQRLAEAARLLALLKQQITKGRSTPGTDLTNDVEVILPSAASIP